MLRYLNSGIRRFGALHISAYKRPNWEFYAVIKGRCGIHHVEFPGPLEKASMLPLKESHLWVFPPQHNHGWYGESNEPCEIAVLHFNRVPAVLEDAMHGLDFLECSLTRENRKLIKRLVRSLEEDYKHPTSLSTLRGDRVLIDLALMILSDAPASVLSTAEQKASEKVQAAMRWLTQHLRERPSLKDVASAVHVSPTQLRRLFAQVREESPRRAMNELQLETASRLLADTDEKLDFIAAECGFSGASDFCRAFKAYRGCSPTQWRRRLPGYDRAFKGWLKVPGLVSWPKE